MNNLTYDLNGSPIMPFLSYAHFGQIPTVTWNFLIIRFSIESFKLFSVIAFIIFEYSVFFY